MVRRTRLGGRARGLCARRQTDRGLGAHGARIPATAPLHLSRAERVHGRPYSVSGARRPSARRRAVCGRARPRLRGRDVRSHARRRSWTCSAPRTGHSRSTRRMKRPSTTPAWRPSTRGFAKSSISAGGTGWKRSQPSPRTLNRVARTDFSRRRWERFMRRPRPREICGSPSKGPPRPLSFDSSWASSTVTSDCRSPTIQPSATTCGRAQPFSARWRLSLTRMPPTTTSRCSSPSWPIPFAAGSRGRRSLRAPEPKG